MKTVEERYKTDAHFNTLVNQMRNLIARADFTPTEIREAAMMAQTLHERDNPSEIRTAWTKDDNRFNGFKMKYEK